MTDYTPADLKKARTLVSDLYDPDDVLNGIIEGIAAALAAEREKCQSSVADLVSAAERVDKAIASIHALPSISNEDAGLSINATWIDLRNALVAIRARDK